MENLTRRFAALTTTAAPRLLRIKETTPQTYKSIRLLSSLSTTSSSLTSSIFLSHPQPPHPLLLPSFPSHSSIHHSSFHSRISPEVNPQKTNYVATRRIPVKANHTEQILPDDLINHPLTPHERTLLATPYTKLKPSFVSQRIGRLRTYTHTRKGIRGSPWKLNLVCQFAAQRPLNEALTQLTFCRKAKAPLVKQVLKSTGNLADIRDNLAYSRLEVAECFATHGTHLKRISYHSKGRSGIKHRRYSHMRVVLREIDFNLKIAQAQTKNQKMRWIMRWRMAMQEEKMLRKEKDELASLEREAQLVLEKKKKEEKK